jgi:hypothetical protein
MLVHILSLQMFRGMKSAEKGQLDTGFASRSLDEGMELALPAVVLTKAWNWLCQP